MIASPGIPPRIAPASIACIIRARISPANLIPAVVPRNESKLCWLKVFRQSTQGVEGVHYEITEDPYIAQIPDSGYAPNADWMYGNQFLAYSAASLAELMPFSKSVAFYFIESAIVRAVSVKRP